MSALSRYVAAVRHRTYQALPFHDWDDVSWRVLTNQSASDPHRRRVYFTAAEDGPAFAEPFATFARALVCSMAASCQKVGSFGPFGYLQSALRTLYAVTPPPPFGIEDYEEEHFTAAEARARLRGGLAGVNVAVKLDWIVEQLRSRRIALIEGWERTLLQGEGAGEPQPALSEGQVMAWAALSAKTMDNDYDHIRQRLLDIMMCTGMRENEVCSLPRDPIVKDFLTNEETGEIICDQDGMPVVWMGLRYWPEKGGAGRTYIKAVPTAFAPVVERAVTEVGELTKRARSAALAHAEGISPFRDDPSYGRLPHDHGMWPDEVASMLGLSGNMMTRGKEFIAQRSIPSTLKPRQGGTRIYHHEVVKKGDVEEALRKDSFLTDCVPRETSVRTPLHDMLFVLAQGMRVDKNGFTGSARLIKDHEVANFIGGHKTIASAFQRYGIELPEEGHFTTKECRAWLSTIAKEEHLHPLDLMRWMGWSQIESAAPYDRRSTQQKGTAARAAMRKARGSTSGSPARPAAKPAEEHIFAEGRAGLVTHIGVCRGSFGRPPCPAFVRGMHEGRWEQGILSLETSDLTAVVSDVRKLVASASAAFEPDESLADEWRPLLATMLAKATAALRIREEVQP